MRIAAHQGARLHAPENTLPALLSGYTSGADVLQFTVQLTKDAHLVLSQDGTTERMTGTPGAIIDKTLEELRALDFSERFQPRRSPAFRYYTDSARRISVLTLSAVLEALPENVELLIELGHESTSIPDRRRAIVRRAAEQLREHDVVSRTVVFGRDPGCLRELKELMPSLRIASLADSLTEDAQIQLMASLNADGLVAGVEAVLEGEVLTSFGAALRTAFEERPLRVGAVLLPPRDSGVFTKSQWATLKDMPFIWSLATASVLDVAFCRPSLVVTDEPFSGRTVDRERFALGYAKANRFCEVSQNNGVHIRIEPYPPLPPPTTDPLERRLTAIERQMIDVARDWPYYSGGGVGYRPGIRGDFAAEVEYTVENVCQATTLEMAVVNVDPGPHQSHPPTSFRHKDSFYDPHGAPPFVGVEHDEDDGYRINWNLGAEYDSNQYGRPVGDGSTPRGGRIRLERRGPYFAAYYRNNVDAIDWVCCGVARNDSLNRTVYLRCVGKRWRQESESDPSQFVPIVPNHFTFRNLRIERFLDCP